MIKLLQQIKVGPYPNTYKYYKFILYMSIIICIFVVKLKTFTNYD